MGPTKWDKGTKLMAVADAAGVPVAVHLSSASPHEVTLVKDTLAASFTRGQPRRLIGDKAYDSDGLDAQLAARGLDLIAPNRAGRCGATVGAGRWRDSSPGCRTSGASSPAMNTTPRTTPASFISAVSSSCSVKVYETASKLPERMGDTTLIIVGPKH